MKCSLCNLSFDNYVGLSTHLARAHKIYKEEAYILVFLSGVAPQCEYQGCTNRPKFRGHSRGGFQRHCTLHRGKWSEGLTSENDARVRKRGVAISKAQRAGKHWSRQPEARELAAERISYARSLMKKSPYIQKYGNLSKGYGWSKGLSRDTDPRMKSLGDAVKQSFKSRSAWSKGLTKETDARLARTSNQKMLSADEIKRRITANGDFILVSELDEYQGIQSHLDFRCKTCNLVQKKSVRGIELGSRCIACFPYGYSSRYEDEIREWVESLGLQVYKTRHVISPYEIDIYVPERNFGIEMNGLYWHSEAADFQKAKHQLKTDLCAQQGITLMHVFEDEWRDKQDIIKSMIAHKLQKSSRRIYARDCSVELNRPDAASFIARTHLDGNVKFRFSISLALKDEIVSCMTFRKPIFTKSNDIEVARYSCEIDTVIVGGLSKLLKYAKQYARQEKFNGIMTYADQRWGKNASYSRVGFSHLKDTEIRFWWTDYTQRYDRFKYRANKQLSEREVAQRARVAKIWGCRNSKFYLQLSG